MASKKERNAKNSEITKWIKKDLVSYRYMWITRFKWYKKTKHILVASNNQFL